MNGPGRRTRAFVAWVLAHGRLLWIVALLLAVPATWRTVTLYARLNSDIEALLPRKAPSVVALGELRARMEGLQYLGVVVDTGTAEKLPAGERLIDDLARRIRAYPPDLARRVQTGNQAERVFLEEHAPLYLDVDDLREIRSRIERRRDYEVTEKLGLSLDDEAPPSLDFSDIRDKYRARLGGARSSAEGARFSSAKYHLTMLLVEAGSRVTGSAGGAELLSRVKTDLAGLGGPEHYAPGMNVGYTGDIAISVEETSALLSDLSLSSVLVVIAVMGVIVFYYRWLWSAAILVPPLLLAAVYSFALASLPPFGVTELNSNTAFLGSIIVGNGINFGIVLLARYVEERGRGAGVEDALVTASWGTRAGTLGAALAAGASYAALSVTKFQGFRQFGIIGGIGMVMSWALAQLLIPPLARWIDDRPSRAPHRSAATRSLTSWVGRMIHRAPLAVTALCLTLTAFALVRVRGFSVDSLEYDFSKLRRADTWTRGEGYWGRRMDQLLGTYLTPMIIVTDGIDETRDVSERLRDEATRAPMREFISRVRTVDDVLPPHQTQKIEEVAAIRKVLTPRIRAELDSDQRDAVDRFLGPQSLAPVTRDEIPPTFTSGMRERTGRLDRAVLVFPKPSSALWQGPSIERFTSELRRAAETRTGSGRVVGPLAISSDIVRSVRRDGPLSSVLALVGVTAAVFIVVRSTRTSLLVLGSLCLGVLWLLGAILALGVRVNFANFIAFPITFGIGVDYAVNVMTRYVQEGRRNIGAVVATTGAAVALCSLTTIIGYSSLLLAQNRALFLFGVVAVSGEIACLSAAIVALPAVIEIWSKRRSDPVLT